MPFTPVHMGPGLFIKALLQGSFSLMVFGWAQIVMDIQPLIVMISGVGHLHGFTHTYIGASLLTVFSALTGKYLSELGLYILGISTHQKKIKISWMVSFASAFIGTFSHVLLDSIMHYDVQPFYPFSLDNDFVTLMNIEQLHSMCLYLGIIGTVMYFLIQKLISKANKPS